MTRKLGYRWHLRTLMASQGMFSTTDLTPLLAERGVRLSAAQVYRLVTQDPQRLSVATLVALCDILQCTPNDLIEPVVVTGRARATGTSGSTSRDPGRSPDTTAAAGSDAGPDLAAVRARAPRRARIQTEP